MDVLVSRQPVVDAEMRVTGYRIAYAALGPEDEIDPRVRSATQLIGDVLSVVGLQELVGATIAHLPLSRELLLTLGIPPVGPDRVMLRLAYEIAIDPELQPILDGLAYRGYALAVHDLPGSDCDLGVLERFGTVEVDFAAWSEHDAANVVPRILKRQGTPLAARVPDHARYERAKELGFQLLAGPFVATPRVISARQVPVGPMRTLVALAQLTTQDAAIEELEQVINRDVGLSVKLLRYINSAYFGLRDNISSIRQAVMMLGARGVTRWALLVALTSGPRTPHELAVMALTRARMCEILGAGRPDVEQDALFTIGLLSVADALLNRPLAEIVEELPLAEEISLALLQRAGPAGRILDAVVTYEHGDFHDERLESYRRDLGAAYRGALRWARRTLAETV